MFIDNSKLILEFFEFKKSLTQSQDDVERIVSSHLDLLSQNSGDKIYSGKDVVSSVTERLDKFTFDNSVKSFLEKINQEIEENSLKYELEKLYASLENANEGMLYRHPMQVVLDILSESNDAKQRVKILNELKNYDWIPAVKNFMFKYIADPVQKANYTSEGGKAYPVISIVEKITEGFLTFVGDKWFLLKEDAVEPTTPSNHLTDVDKLKTLSYLEHAISIGQIKNETINFEIETDLTIGVDFKDSSIYLNDQKLDKSATLENVFASPVIPFMRRDMYPVIKSTIDNIEKFVELDVIQKVTNLTQPHLECFAFNYKDGVYLYSMDKRFGNSFYKYDSASLLVNEMNTALGYDLSTFYKDKFSEEKQVAIELDNKKAFVISKLSEINEGLEKMKMSGLLETSELIKEAYSSLDKERIRFERKLDQLKIAINQAENKSTI